MILQTFSHVSNIAYRKILLNIAVGYFRIECTASTMILKLSFCQVFVVVMIFTHYTPVG